MEIISLTKTNLGKRSQEGSGGVSADRTSSLFEKNRDAGKMQVSQSAWCKAFANGKHGDLSSRISQHRVIQWAVSFALEGTRRPRSGMCDRGTRS